MTTRKDKFDIVKSPLKKAYILLGANNPGRLSTLYTKEDQRLMKAKHWDHRDSSLITNKIKRILEKVNGKELRIEERYWRDNILWLWYHHAISSAIWKYKDKKAALRFATKALEFQPPKHPNKITRLFSYLLNNKLSEAEKWANSIKLEPEKSTAKKLLEIFSDDKLFN